MQPSQIINTTYQMWYAKQFVSEVERVLNENTRDLNGTSERVQQTAYWIENLLLFIQRIGNLADNDSYKVYETCYGFDTNIYDTGIGEIFFVLFYDQEIQKYVIRIIGVNWNFHQNKSGYYNLMYENKENSIEQIIQETINDFLKNNLIRV